MNYLAESKSRSPFAAVMLLTNTLQESPAGGRELLCKLNHDALRDIYRERLTVFQVSKRPIRGLTSISDAFRGHLDGLSGDIIAEVLGDLREKGVTKLFVDGSNFGQLVKIVKRECPDIQICTFFHNVEARFFLGALRHSKTPRALGVLLANYLAERKSVKHSDKIIALSNRDSRLLGQLYGRPATHVSPMALQDKLPPAGASTATASGDHFALFVGGAFYANRLGITWFIKHVAPRVHIKTCVVGRGFEGLENELRLDGKVEVIGEVKSLAEWYLRSKFVIAPIFDGSGMKTKVAEALMFGKKVIGTPEAFSGYETIAHRAGRVCASADDFVAAIEAADTIVKQPFDSELRAAYEATYSYVAARARLEGIMNDQNPH